MARPCSICTHSLVVPITQAMANGTPLKRVAAQFGVAATSLLRHRTNCLNGAIASSTSITKHRSRATAALAVLPNRDQLGQAYEELRVRADAITTQAEKSGSLAIALGGVRELRGILDAVAKLSGHIGTGTSVQVNTQVDIDAGSIVKELLAAIGHRPDATVLQQLEAVAEADNGQ